LHDRQRDVRRVLLEVLCRRHVRRRDVRILLPTSRSETLGCPHASEGNARRVLVLFAAMARLEARESRSGLRHWRCRLIAFTTYENTRATTAQRRFIMFTFRRMALIGAVVVGGMSSAAMADHARYKLMRIPGGPRPDQYVYVRAHRSADRERPYSLTGSEHRAASDRRAHWPAPLHPKGPRGNY
jgi:hypothetical protein